MAHVDMFQGLVERTVVLHESLSSMGNVVGYSCSCMDVTCRASERNKQLPKGPTSSSFNLCSWR